ncbi:Uma2 family endonuclease [Terriglobus sp.]|uniref:Uma2 family endonuclease n=1 Tax=Terriglobus sp. TaxID=1889013 RepID=UPI003B00E40F
MATATLISVAEYLATSYRPDCDYIDGEIQERNLGTRPHSQLQFLLAKWFDQHFDTLGCSALPEQRVRVTPGRFRIADVCVVPADNSDAFIIETTPLACIEVLSPEDRLSRIQDRIDDYTAMGVPNIWVVDPLDHAAWVANGRALQPVSTPELPVIGTPLVLNLTTLFAELDRRLHPTQR